MRSTGGRVNARTGVVDFCPDDGRKLWGSSVEPVDPILVLGAKVRKYSTHRTTPWPAPVLEARLEKARQLLSDDDTLIVVSGKGEAKAMAWWLLEHGVNPSQIMLEYEATSTNENLENAQKLFPTTQRWNVVTSDFHSLRTKVWAWHLGIPITVHTSPTRPPYRGQDVCREIFALAHSLLRVGWRKIVALRAT